VWQDKFVSALSSNFILFAGSLDYTKTPASCFVYSNVDSTNLQPAVPNRYRNTLPNCEKYSKIVKVKVLGLVPGSRSYECLAVF
jgi:hypothetical protein